MANGKVKESIITVLLIWLGLFAMLAYYMSLTLDKEIQIRINSELINYPAMQVCTEGMHDGTRMTNWDNYKYEYCKRKLITG